MWLLVSKSLKCLILMKTTLEVEGEVRTTYGDEDDVEGDDS